MVATVTQPRAETGDLDSLEAKVALAKEIRGPSGNNYDERLLDALPEISASREAHSNPFKDFNVERLEVIVAERMKGLDELNINGADKNKLQEALEYAVGRRENSEDAYQKRLAGVARDLTLTKIHAENETDSPDTV